MLKRRRGKENTEFVRVEFENLFQYTGKMLLEEIASIFLSPFLLIFVVPQFIEEYTVDVEDVGHVCSEYDWRLPAKKRDTVSLTVGGESYDWTPNCGAPALCPVCGLCSLRNGIAHAPCGRVQIRLLAERLAFGHFGPFRVLGLCQLLIVWSRLAGRMMLYVIMSPQSSVSFVRAEDITRLGSAYSIYTVTFVLTQRKLDHYCVVFNIPAELRPELPDRNAIIKDSPEGKIGMYTRLIEFANLWILLSKFLLCILEYYQINLSQLSVIGATKVSHFEIMCRVLGRVPTVGTFRRLYVNSISNRWLSFSKCGGVDDPCCYSKKFDSLKNWNNHFSGLTLCFARYLLHGLVAFPFSRIRFRWMKLRSFTESDVCLTLSHSNDEEVGLLDFVNSADPFKVKIGERTLAENEVPVITETEDRIIYPSPQTINLVLLFPISRPSTSAKSPTALRRLIRQSGQADTGSGSAAPAAEDATSSSVTPTLKRAFDGDFRDNVRTRPPSGRFVVLSSSSIDSDIPTSPQVVPFVSSAQAGVNVPVAEPASDACTSSIPENLLYHVTSPGYWAALRNQHDSGFLDIFNINSAHHVCMVSELRLRYEHEIMMRAKYEKKFTDSAAMVPQRDAEIVDLKAQLEKSEAEAAKVGEVSTLNTHNAGLLEKVSALELVHRELDGKVAQLTADCDGLRDQVVGEGKMREEFVSQQDAVDRHFSERAAEMDARIAKVRRAMDNDLYPHMLTAIVISMAINKGIQQGLEVGVVNGKAGRSLTQIEA
ncbi:putative gypsy type transposase [Tanacetum coccineum]|uniref:Autophagy-related protein 9 n=1 Tax=Tanacetum coccineum TaxID=301880 RepID=A0ABQ5J2I6_9ASTR